jgi:enoyl-CoA hydratase
MVNPEESVASEHVKITVDEGVALVVIDRPPVNAMSNALRREIVEIFGQLNERADVRAVVLTGTPKIFSGGMDLKEHRAARHELGDKSRSEHEHRNFHNALRECSKPIVAAISGPAVGTGVNIAAACDVLVASENAFMAMPEVGVGVPNGASALVRLFGQSRGRRMFFTGMRVSAQELYRLGVIEACVPSEQLLAEAMKIAREIAAQDPDVIAAAKQVYNLAQEVPFAIAKNMENAFTAQLARARAARKSDPPQAD